MRLIICFLLFVFTAGVISASTQTAPVSITSFGAHCDFDTHAPGVAPTDDTAAIQSALTGSTAVTLSFPVGRCLVTGPLTLSNYYISIIGQSTSSSSGIVADFSHWPSGADRHVLTIHPDVAGFSLGQTFRDFSISGSNNGSMVTGGLLIEDTIAGLYLKGMILSNLTLSGFDTCMQLQQVIQSRLQDIHMNNCLVGLNMAGQNVNDTIDRVSIDAFSHAHTSSTGNTVGMSIDQIGTGPGPEGISLLNSSILGADINLYVGQVFHFIVDNDIFDFANNNSVVLANPNNIEIHHCYISSVGTYDSIVAVFGGTNLDGISITDNFLNGGNAAFGVFVTGTHRGMHIERNRIQGVSRPIQINTMPTYSTIYGNYGYANSLSFITIQDATAGCGYGTRIEGNTSADNLAIIESNCSVTHAYSVGFNASAAGTT